MFFAPLIRSKEPVYGSALWCACLGLCKITSRAADPRKHVCVKCQSAMHAICGYQVDDECLCYECVYADQDYARKFVYGQKELKPSVEEVVEWFEKKVSKKGPINATSTPTKHVINEGEAEETASLEEVDDLPKDVENIDALGNDDEVEIITNPVWSQRAML